MRPYLRMGRVRTAAQVLGDRLLDRLAGIDTAGAVSNTELGFDKSEGHHYQTSNWINLINLRRILGMLEISGEDAFVEYGCGKGQVMFLAAHYPFKRIIGIDLSEQLVDIARRNLDPVGRRFACPEIDIFVANAADYVLPDEVNTCYVANSFPRGVLELVMARIESSLASRPRTMRVIYLHPGDHDILQAHGYMVARRFRELYLYVRDQQ